MGRRSLNQDAIAEIIESNRANFEKVVQSLEADLEYKLEERDQAFERTEPDLAEIKQKHLAVKKAKEILELIRTGLHKILEADKAHGGFQNLVEVTERCWNWLGKLSPSGHGEFSTWVDGVCVNHAHRVAYAIEYGEIPTGLYVRHRCANPKCVKPDHLILGESWENSLDVVARNRYRAIWDINKNNPFCLFTYEDDIDIFIQDYRHRLTNARGQEECQEINRRLQIMLQKKREDL